MIFPSESVEAAPLNVMLSPSFAVLGVADICATGGALAGVGSGEGSCVGSSEGPGLGVGIGTGIGIGVSSLAQPLIIVTDNISNPTMNKRIFFRFMLSGLLVRPFVYIHFLL